MNDQEPMQYARNPSGPEPDGGSDLLVSLISAGLFLYVGFGLSMVGVSQNPLYDGSVALFTWGARIIGIAILVGAGLSVARLPVASLIDLLIAAAATGLCAVVGVIWLLFSDMQGLLILLFALLNGRAAQNAWVRWNATRGGPVS